MQLFDAIEVAKPRLTKDGYLVAEAQVARTGIQLYAASELGLDGDPDRVIRVYRPPEEVFHADAMASYAHRPITVDHPKEMVDAKNWKKHAKGQTGDEVLRDGEFVRVPIMLMDRAAIDEWEAGKRQLSMGYSVDFEIGEGETPDGKAYDAIQKNLRMNHLALVSRARGGSDLKLGDNQPEVKSMDLKKIMVDGLPIETTEAGATAISKLQTELADAQKATEDQQEAHAQEIAGKDKELAAKDAEIESLKGKILSEDDLDKRVADRADLIATAKGIADKDYSGLSDAEIRKTAVIAKLGQDAIEGKSEDYVEARFDILAEDAGQDGVRKILKTGDAANQDDAEKAHAGMVKSMEDAWKQTGEEA